MEHRGCIVCHLWSLFSKDTWTNIWSFPSNKWQINKWLGNNVNIKFNILKRMILYNVFSTTKKFRLYINDCIGEKNLIFRLIEQNSSNSWKVINSIKKLGKGKDTNIYWVLSVTGTVIDTIDRQFNLNLTIGWWKGIIFMAFYTWENVHIFISPWSHIK